MPTLATHGFVDVDISEGCENVCEVIPRARDIVRLGEPQMIAGQRWRFLERSLGESGTYVGWTLLDLYREGTYGKVYRASRMVVKRRPDGLFDVVEPPTEVVVKQTEPPTGAATLSASCIQSHVSEALLHVLSWQTMQTTSLPWAVPHPYEVFGDHKAALPGWISMSLCMSYVRGRTLHSFLSKHWLHGREHFAANGRLLLELLAHVAYILYHLQRRLRLNHRDVKVNNLLVRRQPAGAEPVRMELDGITVTSTHELTLIDFGFACVGCPPPRAPITAFEAGSWFPPGELCCKVGRDIAQLIFCIHCYFPLEDYLEPDLVTELRRWVTVSVDGRSVDMLRGFTTAGHPYGPAHTRHPEFHTGIYEFLSERDVDPMLCAPLTVFQMCAALLSSRI